MQIPKEKIMEMIKAHGEDDKTQQAHKELPETVDTDQHSGLLDKFGVDATKLVGGLGNKLGM
ncbi:MAG TPA: hypothetical protein VFX16_35525 [Pseudonocardiaceae bacterium]|nr:hypothetical protein [Pseudonocardiaceae bacterium]